MNDEPDEEDADEGELIALNQEDELSMEFEEERGPEQLEVNLENLLSGHGGRTSQIITNQLAKQGTPQGQGRRQSRRSSRRGSKRDSVRAKDILGVNKAEDNTLFDFFKSLDFRPNQASSGTVRASYKSGRGSYSLYGVAGQRPGDKGQIFVQSQEGFDRNLPPMKLTERQRDNLISDFQELERLSSVVESESEEDPQKCDEANIRERKTVNREVKLQSLVQAYGRSATPSRTKHAMAANIQKDNKSFWSSGVENHIKAPTATTQKHLINKQPNP